MARAHASSVINAPIEQVWARIRDFKTLDDWHPGISSSVIEDGGPSDRVGCIRRMELRGGGVIREQLLEMSDLGHHYSYSILESPLPVTLAPTVSISSVAMPCRRSNGDWLSASDWMRRTSTKRQRLSSQPSRTTRVHSFASSECISRALIKLLCVVSLSSRH